MGEYLVLLTGGAPAAPPSSSGGMHLDENLLQAGFLVLILIGVALAAALYVANVLDVPWRRAMSNTDRQAIVNGLMITFIAVIVGIYTLVEPARLASATNRQMDYSINRGMNLYGQYCIGCHGLQGQGGPVPADIAEAAFAPPLAGRADLRPESQAERAQKADFLRKVIERGRPNTAMPGWSIAEGGALNSQDIENLVDFVQRGDFASVTSVMSADAIAKAEATAFAGGAANSSGGPGRALFLSKGCAACHAIKGVSSGTVGPALTTFGSSPQIAGVLQNTRDNLIRWILNPPAVKPGTQMPKLATITQQDAEVLADYLQSLK